MCSAPAAGRAPSPRLKAYENRTYNFPASSGRGIVSRILTNIMKLAAAQLEADQSDAMIFSRYFSTSQFSIKSRARSLM